VAVVSEVTEFIIGKGKGLQVRSLPGEMEVLCAGKKGWGSILC
jgi:hypothetical protein